MPPEEKWAFLGPAALLMIVESIARQLEKAEKNKGVNFARGQHLPQAGLWRHIDVPETLYSA